MKLRRRRSVGILVALLAVASPGRAADLVVQGCNHLLPGEIGVREVVADVGEVVEVPITVHVLDEAPVAALAPSPQISALMSPFGEPLVATNSTRAFLGKRRSSHAPWFFACSAQSRPSWMRHAPDVAFQSGPSTARSIAGIRPRSPN